MVIWVLFMFSILNNVDCPPYPVFLATPLISLLAFIQFISLFTDNPPTTTQPTQPTNELTSTTTHSTSKNIRVDGSEIMIVVCLGATTGVPSQSPAPLPIGELSFINILWLISANIILFMNCVM